MMDTIQRCILFYAIAGIVVGATVASMETVKGSLFNRPVPRWFARVFIFIVCALCWPIVMGAILFAPLKGKRDGTT